MAISGRTVINFCIKHASLFSKGSFTSLIWHFNTLAQILIKLSVVIMWLSCLCHQIFIVKCCIARKRKKFHLFKFCRNRIAPEILHVNKPLLMKSICTIGDCTKEYYRFVMYRFCTHLMCLTQPVGVPNISIKILAYCRICQFKVNYKSVMFYSQGPVLDWKNEEVICWVEVHS